MSALYLLRFQNSENKNWFKIGRSNDVHARARCVSGTLGLPTKILCTIANGGKHETTMVQGLREVYGAVPTAGRELFYSTCTDSSVCKVFKRYYSRVQRAHIRPKTQVKMRPVPSTRKALHRSGTAARRKWLR